MSLGTAKILCVVGLAMISASALFIVTSYNLGGRREWKRCEQERSVYQQGVYGRSPRCLELEDRFKTGAVLALSGVVLVLVARPGSRARKKAGSRA